MASVINPKVLRRKESKQLSDPIVPNLQWHVGKRRVSVWINPWIDGKQYHTRIDTFAKTLPVEMMQERIKAVRTEAWHLKEAAADGIVPEAYKRRRRRVVQQEKQLTVGHVFEEAMKLGGEARADGKERWRKWNVYLRPAFDNGERPIAEISRADLKEILLERHAEAPTQARRLRSLITWIFVHATSEGYIDTNPAVAIKLPTADQRRDRVLSAQEIAHFWHGLEDRQIHLRSKHPQQTRLILKLCLVLGQRRSEIVNMHWRDIDAEKRLWTTPETKSGRKHLVPIGDLAWSLISQAGTAGGFVFATGPHGRPPAPNNISQSMNAVVEHLGLEDVVLHDLRRAYSSNLGDLAVPRDIVKLLLNHKAEGVTGEVYELSTRWDERVDAVEKWSARLQEIIDAPPPDNVRRLERVG